MRRLMFSGAVALVIYSVSICAAYTPVHGQTSQLVEEVWKNDAKLSDMEARVARDESAATALQNRVDSMSDQLSALKTTSEANNKLLMGALGGIVIILLERGISIVGRRRPAITEDGDV